MPLGPFRRKKKKKKDLPKPPSFSEEDDSPFSGPPRELLRPPQVKRTSPLEPLSKPTGSPRETKFKETPQTSELQGPPQVKTPSPQEALSKLFGPPRELNLTEIPQTSELKGPPQVKTPSSPKAITDLSGPPRESPPIRESPIYEGPPRQPHTKGVTSPSNLPSPPPLSEKIPTPPPISSDEAPVPIFNDGAVTNEIHAELRKRKFGSDMEKIPKRKAAAISTDELTKRHFQETRQNYIEAGNKHLELDFYDNAATNYACAILCDLIVEGWQVARRTMSKLSTGTPSTLTDNNIFDSVRLIIEAIRTKNYNFLARAERTIQSNTEHLYPEDIAIIERGLKTARTEFGYG